MLETAPAGREEKGKREMASAYATTEYPLERNGIPLHLDSTVMEEVEPEKDILLLHGVTYSSNTFHTDYKDYSFIKRLAREGYNVWRLDIAGYGGSGPVEDGFMPDTDYAAEDIFAAVKRILDETGRDKVDLLGWSWGTITTSRFAVKHPEFVDRLVLFGPILRGIGEFEISEPFHHNTWEQAAEDFQLKEDGTFDYDMTDPVVIDTWCSNCWRYDGDKSPNGGRRDASVPSSVRMIEPEKLSMPALLICGGNDPYMDYDMLKDVLDFLPEGSEVKIIGKGSHVVIVEKPYYHEFQDSVVKFLRKALNQ